MGFNIGAFAGGLAQGWNQGMKMSEDYRRIKQRGEAEEAARTGLETAKQARQEAIDSQVNYLAPDDGTDPGYRVGSKVYATKEEAQTAAAKEVPSESYFYADKAIPMMRDLMLKQGRVKDAEAFSKWGEEAKNRDTVNTYGKALVQLMSGDHDNGIKGFGKYYERINDGVDYTGHELVKDEEGNVTGYALNLKDRRTGKTSVMQTNKDQLLQLANAWSPEAFIDGRVSQYEAALAARSKRAEKDYDTEAKERGEIAGDQRKHLYKLEEQRQESQLSRGNEQFRSGLRVTEEGSRKSAQINAIRSALRDQGYTEAEIKTYLPSILNIGNYKKTTDPQERAALVVSDLIKNDPRFARLPLAEQKQKVRDIMGVIGSMGDPEDGPASGLPAQNSGGLPVFDPRTGQTTYR